MEGDLGASSFQYQDPCSDKCWKSGERPSASAGQRREAPKAPWKNHVARAARSVHMCRAVESWFSPRLPAANPCLTNVSVHICTYQSVPWKNAHISHDCDPRSLACCMPRSHPIPPTNDTHARAHESGLANIVAPFISPASFVAVCSQPSVITLFSKKSQTRPRRPPLHCRPGPGPGARCRSRLDSASIATVALGCEQFYKLEVTRHEKHIHMSLYSEYNTCDNYMKPGASLVPAWPTGLGAPEEAPASSFR